MNATFARVRALMLLAVAFVLAHLDAWYRRTWCFYDVAPQNVKELNEAMQKAFDTMSGKVKQAEDLAGKALDEIKKYGTLHGETNEGLKKIGEELKPLSDAFNELKNRIGDLEQRGTERGAGGGEQPKTAGQIYVESEAYKALQARGPGVKGFTSDGVKVGAPREHKATIVNATGQNQPLVAVTRIPGMVVAPEQRLTIRDLIPVIRVSGNAFEYVKENVFTNNAGPQYDGSSPTPQTEGVVKNESGITFTLATGAIITLAHWIPASRQVLSDAPFLQDYIDMRLRYGLKLEEEDELLNGDGTSGTLNGLNNQATAFAGGATNQSLIDSLLKAMTQVRLAFYEPNGQILNPQDWESVLLAKDTTGRYLFGDPHRMEAPNIWGKPVVSTVSQARGTFTTGAFDRAAFIADREDMTVRISDQHADFFTRNLVAILCEERLGLAVTRPAAIVKGATSYAG